mmetsp:Transcript_36353/g.109491  ORF Transcript_36353/g.109491 Transcript_36353/m.109491 type:complete len:264 (+) Transcript_36353:17-808(+)
MGSGRRGAYLKGAKQHHSDQCKLTEAGETHFGFGVAKPNLIMACLVFLRALTVPSGQRWQYVQSWPLWQPTGFQYQAQGLQSPEPCSADPPLPAGARCSRPGGISRPRLRPATAEPGSCRRGVCGAEPAASSCSEPVLLRTLMEAWSQPPDAVDSGSELNARHTDVGSSTSGRDLLSAWRASCSEAGVGLGVARPRRMTVRLAFFLALISPSGQRWQWPHSCAFSHPWAFQNQAHGRHWPVPCSNEPWLGEFWGGRRPGGNCT